MTSVSDPDNLLDSKRRGLERLHLAGVVTEAKYRDMLARLGASPAAPPPPAPPQSAAPPPPSPGPAPVVPPFRMPPQPDVPAISVELVPAAPAPRWSFGPPAVPGPAPRRDAEASRSWGIRESPRQAAAQLSPATQGTRPRDHAAPPPAADQAPPGSSPPAPAPCSEPRPAPFSPAGSPRRRPSGRLLGATAAALVVAIAGAAVAAGHRPVRPSTAAMVPALTAAPTPGGTPAPSGRLYSSIADFVPDARAFVAAHRGLDWKRDVKVVALPEADFLARLHSGQRPGATPTSGSDLQSRTFQALRLIPGGTGLSATAANATDAGVAGFYDPSSGELDVRGTAPTPLNRRVVIHELTHALQDQWFDLRRLLGSATDEDSYEARLALVEGDARRIELQYAAGLTAAEQQQVEQVIGATRGQLDSFPPALLVLLSFPYTSGTTFVDALIATRGQSALDAAFRTPPEATAAILVPDRYVRAIAGTEVATPHADGPLLTAGHLGALGFEALFTAVVRHGGMTPSQGVLAAGNVSGDRYAVYGSGSRTCVRDTVALADPGLHAFADALARWAALTPGSTVTAGTGGRTLTLTSCTA